MQREKLPGTLVLWPGVAEELLATKAYYVRAGLFKDFKLTVGTFLQAGPGHNWANAIAMATPIAHKGVVAGANVQA